MRRPRRRQIVNQPHQATRLIFPPQFPAERDDAGAQSCRILLAMQNRRGQFLWIEHRKAYANSMLANHGFDLRQRRTNYRQPGRDHLEKPVRQRIAVILGNRLVQHQTEIGGTNRLYDLVGSGEVPEMDSPGNAWLDPAPIGPLEAAPEKSKVKARRQQCHRRDRLVNRHAAFVVADDNAEPVLRCQSQPGT